MGNLQRKEFSKIKAQAEAFYLSVETVYCPALQAEIHFSSEGFRHFQYDGKRVERTKNVQLARMQCLQEAVAILKSTTTLQEYRTVMQPIGKMDSQGMRQQKHVTYYAFQAITNLVMLRRIIVIVRRVNEGNLHFWSTMPAWKIESSPGAGAARSIGGGWMLEV